MVKNYDSKETAREQIKSYAEALKGTKDFNY